MKRAERGYLSRYITGWLDLRSLKMLDYGALARLLIAYIDDARAVDDEEALRIFITPTDICERRKRPGTHHQYDENRTGKVPF
jgi:hypothetical protein